MNDDRITEAVTKLMNADRELRDRDNEYERAKRAYEDACNAYNDAFEARDELRHRLWDLVEPHCRHISAIGLNVPDFRPRPRRPRTT